MNSPIRWLRLASVACFCLMLWGCLEYSITTQLMPNGNLRRTIAIRGDSAAIFKGTYRVPDDTSWQIQTRYETRDADDTTGEMIFVYEASRLFSNFEEVNRVFFRDTSFNDHLNIRLQVSKQFRFFYTYYHYRETFGMLFPFRSEPLEKYVSQSELEVLTADEKLISYDRKQDSIVILTDTLEKPVISGMDSLRLKMLRDTIDKKFEKWRKMNIYQSFYAELNTGMTRLGMAARLASSQASLYKHFETAQVFDSDPGETNAFLHQAAIFLETDSDELYQANRNGFGLFNRKWKVSAIAPESFRNQVLMPGLVVKTNAREIAGNSVTWNFKPDNFYAADYTMEVSARAVNRWFIVISVLLLMALLGLILVRLFGKKNPGS